jgi:ABC-2 type transport system permease protein/sodium transport system permease protein
MALVPALSEELFFRGYLFRALSYVCRPALTIVFSALLFGFFHVLIYDVLVPERLVASTLLGLVLGWVRWRSGSVWPGMVLHACHNGILMLMTLEPETLGSLAGLSLETTGALDLVLTWPFLAGVAGTLLGAWLMSRVGTAGPAAELVRLRGEAAG